MAPIWMTAVKAVTEVSSIGSPSSFSVMVRWPVRDTDEHEARDQLKAFVEAGGTLVDTAAGYGDGASEELIGSLLGDVVTREDVVLATKAGVRRARGSSRAREVDVSRGSLLRTLDG